MQFKLAVLLLILGVVAGKSLKGNVEKPSKLTNVEKPSKLTNVEKPSKLTNKAVTTQNSDQFFVPCKSRIVFAVDDTNGNNYFSAAKSFLVNQVFSTQWNVLERLGLVFFSYGAFDKNAQFGTYHGNSSSGLDTVRQAITGFNTRYGTLSLTTALQNLASYYQPNDDYPDVNYIVFLSAIDQDAVNASKKYAAQLGYLGRLTIVGLGNIDPKDTLLRQLTSYYIQWKNPTTDPNFNGWGDFFWSTAYGCTGTNDYLLRPCDGQINLLLDTSSALAQRDFSDQAAFVGQNLFTIANFNNYQRLSIGSYNQLSVKLKSFDTSSNAGSVQTYVNNITQCSQCVANLRKALYWIDYQEYDKAKSPPITFVIFVSHVAPEEVDDAKFAAQQVLSQGVRLVLVAHGGDVKTSVLTQITGNSSLVYDWPVKAGKSTNYGQWLTQAMNCPQN
ncbi:hypothetical protein M3Y97_00950600 [Aphelenchoides bicaudatus]|nr:hypothetical protein M3Y97_00950600 [Aphelenchoides bicaudatus]